MLVIRSWLCYFLPGLLVCCFLESNAQTLVRVPDFGNNPGNLRMYVYEPAGLTKEKGSPVVVVLHGCLQNAKRVANQTGWNKLADRYGWRIIYPQQKILNNPQKCFCWYNENDIEKDKGEVYSIYKMVEFVKENMAVDSEQIFVTGLSAGAAMSVALMATYPETFNAGAVFAGGPYKVATNLWTGMMAMYGWRIKKAEAWGNYVREQNPLYNGNYPRMIIFHGKADVIVNRRNATELVKQWTNLHRVKNEPTEIVSGFAGARSIERRTYCDSSGNEKVVYYKIKAMGHALPVNPGKCETKGGKMGAFSADKNFFSTYYTAVDFGLIALPSISGLKNVSKQQAGVQYSVPAKENTTFLWRVPKGCRITTGQGTNTITVTWGNESGNVDVQEVQSEKCRKAYGSFKVTAD
ncbi:MAG: PHB depolymerase family esterase [Chitinophagales bacterium]|nr:PHB depolymerase family esterase [Chitinophagales bacterium]